MAVFIARGSYHLDPGTPWSLELLVRRQTGPVAGFLPALVRNIKRWKTISCALSQAPKVAAIEEE